MRTTANIKNNNAAAVYVVSSDISKTGATAKFHNNEKIKPSTKYTTPTTKTTAVKPIINPKKNII